MTDTLNILQKLKDLELKVNMLENVVYTKNISKDGVSLDNTDKNSEIIAYLDWIMKKCRPEDNRGFFGLSGEQVRGFFGLSGEQVADIFWVAEKIKKLLENKQ